MSDCLYCEEAQAERERTGLEYVCPVHRNKPETESEETA